jgi:hypothetical protein
MINGKSTTEARRHGENQGKGIRKSDPKGLLAELRILTPARDKPQPQLPSNLRLITQLTLNFAFLRASVSPW